MANRIIKESICRSEEIDNLSWFEEVLFYRLIVNCDDYGRFDGRVKIIKSMCFPLKDIRDSDLEKALQSLTAQGLVIKYEVQGKPVLQLTTWERHQRIRTKVSKYPSMDEADAGTLTDRSRLPQIAADCGEMLLESNPIQSEYESEYESEEHTRARKPADQKHAHGEHGKVMLTDEELEKLNAEYGVPETLDAIAWFDSYIAEKGYKSKSHYLAMRRWVYGAVAERKAKIPRERSGTFNASEYLRRKIEEAENDECGSMETGYSS